MDNQRRSASHRRRLFGAAYVAKVLGYGPIAYWPMNEAAGTTATELIAAQNATYSGVTLGQAGIGDGNTSVYLDGANDYINPPNLAIDKDVGTVMLWYKSTHLTPLGSGYLYRYRLDANNTFFLSIETADRLLFRRVGNGTSIDVRYTGLTGLTSWLCIVITWSVAGNAQNITVNAVAGTPSAGLAGWSGGDAIIHFIGAYNSTPNNVITGNLTHVAIWDKLLTTPQIADLYSV